MVTIPTTPSGTFGSYKPTAQPKKSILPVLTVIGIVILIGAAGYYFFIYQGVDIFAEQPVLLPAPPLTALETKVSQLSGLSLGVIDSSFYKSLVIYGSVPVIADSLGRKNPFIPY